MQVDDLPWGHFKVIWKKENSASLLLRFSSNNIIYVDLHSLDKKSH